MIDAAKETSRILQVGSQRVSSIVYAKARELYRSGAIGELNFVEAWWHRNSPIGAWQYTIPPDASPETVDWDRFLGNAPKRPFEPIRLFRWRNYRDYGTGIPGDLFVHLFSAFTSSSTRIGPTRVMATGGLRYWHDGRDVPDIARRHLRLPEDRGASRLHADAEGELCRRRRRRGASVPVRPVLRVSSPSAARRRRWRGSLVRRIRGCRSGPSRRRCRRHHQQPSCEVPEQTALRPREETVFAAPSGYSDTFDHFRNFFDAVRTRKPVVEDAVFGYRAAGPAVLTNRSYFEERPIGWDPEKMRRTTAAAKRR